jgi:YVTN family beta-propeller protein
MKSNSQPAARQPARGITRRNAVQSIAYIMMTITADMLFAALRVSAQQEGRPIKIVDLEGEHPGVPSITPDGRFLVSVNQESSNLSIVEIETQNLVGTIELSGKREPWEIAFTPDGKLGFVTHSSFDTSHGENSIVTVVDMDSRKEVKQIAVGRRPNGAAVDRSGKYVAIANMGSNSVSLISVSKQEVLKEIPVGKSPFDVAFTPDNTLVVVNFFDASLSFVDVEKGSVFDTLAVGTAALSDPYPEFGAGDSAQIAVNSWNGDVYVTNYRTHNLVVVDSRTRTIKARITTIQFPFGVNVSEEANICSVLSGESRALGLIDLGAHDFMTERFGGLGDDVRAKALGDIDAQANQQIEVIPLGRGGGKPPLRLTRSRASDITFMYVDPIRGLLYILPKDPNSETGLLLFGGREIFARQSHSGA